MPYIIAHDLGTSGNKATLYSADGRLVAARTESYPLIVTHGNWAQQRAQDWWQAVCRSTRALLEGVDPADVAAVSFSGQMMGCLCLDRDGEPLQDAIIWADMRSTRQEQSVRANIPEREFYRITGQRISPSYGGFKLRWLKDEQRAVYDRTAVMLNAKDYIAYKLTGVLATEGSDASSTCLYDLNTGSWSPELIGAFGVDREKLPDVIPSTAVVGKVTAEAARLTGLLAGTPVVMGGGDGPMAAVGTGCVKEGVANSCMGTSSWIAMAAKKPISDENMTTVNFGHVVPGYVVPTGTMQSGGGSLSWAVKQLCGGEKAAAELEGRDVYDRVEEAVRRSPAGSKGLLFLPHLIGERSPLWDPQARGAFVGLTLEHTLDDVMRAVMEGVALTLDMVLDAFTTHIPVEELVVVGGGARSSAWMQMFADVYGVTIKKPVVLEEACSMGAAVTAGVGVGLFEDFSVIDRFITVEGSYLPDEENHARYRQLKPIFRSTYPVMKDTLHRLGDFQRAGE